MGEEGMFADIPVEVGVTFEGERVRGKQMQVELGGPKITEKFEIVQARKKEEVTDGKVIVKGPDIKDMELGKTYPIGVLLEVAGPLVEPNLEAIVERRFHEFVNYVEGIMHLNQRYDVWMRLNQASFKKGFDNFEVLGKILFRLFKAEMGNVISDLQITFMTDPKEIKPWYEKALKIYEKRDKQARELSDEDVDMFYGCTLCASFAPTHCCIITPDRISLCGAINYFDAAAAAKVDPKGPLFAVEKGELLDPVKGIYTGANEAIKKKSLGEIKEITLYTILDPRNHTSCGCFEAIAFYIPEVEGYGIVDRKHAENTVNGLRFSTMANSTGGGKQTEGFVGIAIEYMRSPKFFQADGGYNKLVWLPDDLKQRISDAIPKDLVDKIATEKIVASIGELKDFLKSKDHPVVKDWVEEEEEEEEEVATGIAMPAGGISMLGSGGGAGVKIILKGATITADEIIIERPKKGKKKKK